MQASGKTVHLVPLTVNYERVFELRNLAIEMVSGDIPEESTFSLWKRINKEGGNNKLGRANVIFGNPINLKDWIKQEQLAPLSADNLDEAGLRLSERLLQKQQSASPISLNSIVASLLLQTSLQRLSLNLLHQNVTKIYQYLVTRDVNTFITMTPNKASVQDIVKKLGFEIVKVRA